MTFRNLQRPAATGRSLLCSTLAAAVCLAPLPVLAAPPAEGEAEAAPAATEVGGNIALLMFGGNSDVGTQLRANINYALQGQGYSVSGIKRSGEDAATKNKCQLTEDSCLKKIGAYLNKNARTPFDFFVFGDGAVTGQVASITIYDINANKRVKDIRYTGSLDDVIMAYTLPPALARAVAQYQVPAAPLSDEEKAALAALDEPAKTPEEIKAEEQAIADAGKAGANAFDANVDAGEQRVDLKKDFKAFCRTGAREDKVSTDLEGEEVVERDRRPVCKRGAFFGYWQPKAYVVLSITAIAAVGTGLMYGLALGARGDWKKAKDNLNGMDLNPNSPGDAALYGELATDVTTAGFKVRRRAIVGDALLGTTLVFGGLLGIIIWQERQQAKDFTRREGTPRHRQLEREPCYWRRPVRQIGRAHV